MLTPSPRIVVALLSRWPDIRQPPLPLCHHFNSNTTSLVNRFSATTTRLRQRQIRHLRCIYASRPCRIDPPEYTDLCLYMCVRTTSPPMYTNIHAYTRLSVCVAAHRVRVPCVVYHATHRHSRSAMPANYSPISRNATRICPAPRVSCRRRTVICWTESNGSPTRRGHYLAMRSPVRAVRRHARSKQPATAIRNFRSSRRCWVRCRPSETVTPRHWVCIV